jgi:hypothetical protein
LLAGKVAAIGLLPLLVPAVEHAAVETLVQRVQLHEDISACVKVPMSCCCELAMEHAVVETLINVFSFMVASARAMKCLRSQTRRVQDET